jgi:hypothetical protein
MNQNEYSLGIGRVFVNLHALEFSIRLFLQELNPDSPPNSLKIITSKLKVGQSLPVDALTNYDTMGELISKYNMAIESSHPQYTVDKSIPNLRDALAHGRVWSANPNPPTQLVKFSKPTKDGMTTVTHVELMDSDWLKKQTTHIHAEIVKVYKAGQALKFKNWFVEFVPPLMP